MSSKPAGCGRCRSAERSVVKIRWSVLAASLVALAAVAATAGPACACNTPVYRYAMYNWQTAPFFVFYFYEGEVAKEDQAVNQAIAKLTEDLPAQANLRIELVNVADKKQMERLPEFVVEAWKSQEGGRLPAHLVIAPWRAPIFAGRLNDKSVAGLIDSPARQRFGQLLEEGNAAVMILLTCANEEENKKAEQALAELCKRADAGKIPVELDLPLPAAGGAGGGGAGASAPQDAADVNKLRLAVLKVDRKDPAEEYFVRTLMAVEPDLQEYADQPMIFAGYGRGRAMEPYIGKGITTDNLVEVVAFLAGACSCMVKEQNPGVDLLVKWNWEATADKMAENDPSLDASPYGLFGYNEMPADPAQAAAESKNPEPATEPAEKSKEPAELAAAAGVAADPPAAGKQPAPNAAANDPAVVEPTGQPAPQAGAIAPNSDRSPTESGSYVKSRLWSYGLGLGAIAAGVILAGLALLLRRA